MMSLEDELAINQFGQGACSAADLLDRLNQLDKDKQRKRFIDLYFLVWSTELIEADVEQALAACSLTTTDAVYAYLHLHRVSTGLTGALNMPESENPPAGKFDKSFELLLYLFKAGYQRRFKLEMPDSPDWRYWDLSNSEIAQGIVTRYRALVDQIYNTAGFRSEFASIAKLWHEHDLFRQAQLQELTPDSSGHVGFVTYDEIVTKSVVLPDYKRMQSIGLLQSALTKALAKTYGLAADQVNRLLWEVVDRHLEETYHTSLYK